MNVRMQHFFRIASTLLVLTVLLSGQAPFATALETRQEPPPGRVVQGSGDFPRLSVVAPAADGSTLALYLVEGDQATQLLEFEGLRTGHDEVIVRLSPGGKHIAVLLLESWDGDSTLEVVDLEGVCRVTLDRGAGDLTPERGAAHEKITGLAWLDDEHVLYSKVTMPSTGEFYALSDTGTLLPVRGEIWLADLQGETQQLVAGSPVERVLGASPDGKHIYSVCYPEPERERHRGQGICVMDVASGDMRMLWPSPERPLEGGSPFNEILTACTLVAMPDGTPRVAFATTEKHDGPREQPPDVWLADPESGKAEHVWAATQEDPTLGQKLGWGYDLPLSFLWSPRSEREFVYLASGQTWGGAWWVDTEAGQSRRLADAGRLLTWTSEGIVVQTEGVVQLLDENGKVQGEIRFGGERALAPLQVSSVVVDYDVPYVHQRWDTPEWWDVTGRWGGDWSCGPASAVMALAYFNQLAKHTISVTKPRSVTHASDYGWYVPTDSCDPGPCGYTHVSACEGTNTFDDTSPYNEPYADYQAAGAHGACVNADGVATKGGIEEYVQKHDVGFYYESSPTETKVQGELDGGALVLLDTRLLGAGVGHFVVVRGYTDDSTTRYIVNDPWGDKSSGTYDTCENNQNIHCGEGVQYTWSQLSGTGYSNPKWYVAVYGPEYLPYLYESSTWDNTLIIQNGDKPTSAWTARVKVCFMNPSGSFNTSRDNDASRIPVNGIWNLPLSDVFGYFNGSAVAMRYQTGVSTIARSQRYDEITIYNAIRGGGGSLGWQRVGTTLYVPVVKSNWYGRYSQIRVLNVGGASTDVTVRYYRYDNGEQQGDPSTQTLAPNARGTFYASSRCPSGYHCSAVITSSSGQSLAAVVREYASGDTAPTTHNAFSKASTTNYVPVVKNSYYGQTSGLAVNNTSAYWTYATVTYYDSNSSNSYSSGGWICPRGTKAFYDPAGLPDGFLGSAVVSAGRPIVSAMHEAGSGRYKATNAYLAGGKVLFTPELNTTSGHGSGISIQNAGNSSAEITVHYYHSDGASAGTRGPYTIAVGKTRILSNWNGGVPSGLYGSAWIESTNEVPVVATVNYAGSGSGDVHATYNGCQP